MHQKLSYYAATVEKWIEIDLLLFFMCVQMKGANKEYGNKV